jgi:hypothetical protein
MSEDLFGIASGLIDLQSHIHDGLAWVRDRVGTEFDMLVLDNDIPQEIAQGVILIEEGVGG